jgi:hypothetical protein
MHLKQRHVLLQAQLLQQLWNIAHSTLLLKLVLLLLLLLPVLVLVADVEVLQLCWPLHELLLYLSQLSMMACCCCCCATTCCSWPFF